MKAVIQRVARASVEVDGKTVAAIGPGLLTLLGVAHGDTEQDAQRLIKKIIGLRIFEDSAGKMNRSLLDCAGEHLVVSQFTLVADTESGRRPSFTEAERPDAAKRLWELALKTSQNAGVPTVGGVFQADMQVSLVNDGPVTFILES